MIKPEIKKSTKYIIQYNFVRQEHKEIVYFFILKDWLD